MKRRRVVCDGVKGVLAYHDGQWVLENEAELAVLEALGCRLEGMSGLLGIIVALNSRAAGANDVKNLNRCLRSIASAEPVWTARVDHDLWAAAAVVCAYWNHPKAIDWLCWAISACYEHNLSQAPGTYSPGYESFSRVEGSMRRCTYRRDVDWMPWIGDDFWRRLASHESSEVREVAEAIDPNTSPERLEDLWMSYPHAVGDIIASRPDIPDSILRHVSHIERQSRFIRDPSPFGPRMHFSRNSYNLYRIAQNLAMNTEIIRALAGVRFLSQTQTKEFYAYIEHAYWELLIHHPNRDNKTVEKLASVPCNKAICWIASHSRTGGQTLKRILDEHPIEGESEEEHCEDDFPTWKIWASAAANPAMPTGSLSMLVESPLYQVRASVASNPSTPLEDLTKLAEDHHREVRSAAATSPKLPRSLLEQLARDSSALVRASIAESPATPNELLMELAYDTIPKVRRSLAKGGKTPEDVLEILASDSDREVKYLVAKHESAPQSALARLARDCDKVVRGGVASNPSSPTEALTQLAEDSDIWIRVRVARHPSPPASVLKKLASDPEICVREAVARHPKTPKNVLTALASDPESRIRRAVAKNSSTPSRVLERLAGDSNPTVLEELASNPSTPTGVLERLAQTEWARVFHPALDALAEREAEETVAVQP